jgi:hypothetical protein
VWSVLYVMIGVAGWLVLTSARNVEEGMRIATEHALHLGGTRAGHWRACARTVPNISIR